MDSMPSVLSLDDAPQDIIRLNQRRWEIEESFRIMKTEFKARPVYLSREDRIRAHFFICFLSLMIYRYLEKKTPLCFYYKRNQSQESELKLS